jgi:hypothetical protein
MLIVLQNADKCRSYVRQNVDKCRSYVRGPANVDKCRGYVRQNVDNPPSGDSSYSSNRPVIPRTLLT